MHVVGYKNCAPAAGAPAAGPVTNFWITQQGTGRGFRCTRGIARTPVAVIGDFCSPLT